MMDFEKLYALALKECRAWREIAESIGSFTNGCGCCSSHTASDEINEDKELQEAIAEHNSLNKEI
jgi:hypothetical protein